MSLVRLEDTWSIYKNELLLLVMNNWKLDFKKLELRMMSKNMKYLGMHCIKYVQDFYARNYETLLRKIKRLE